MPKQILSYLLFNSFNNKVFNDLIEAYTKTWCCFASIILSPIVGLYSPKKMIDMYVAMSLATKSPSSSVNFPPVVNNTDFSGMEQVLEVFDNEYIKIFKDQDRAAGYNLKIPSGLMLYGPPGCGKTYTAKNLVDFAATKEVKLKFMSISAGDIGSKYRSEPVANIRRIFQEAKKQPTLLFIDECEGLFGNRDSIQGGSANDQEEICIINEFLQQLQEARSSNIIVVGATNHINTIDPAFLRPGRFDYKIEISLPDEQTRIKLLTSQLHKVSEKDETVDYNSIAKGIEGYSIAEITHLIENVCRKAFRDKTKVSQKTFTEVLDNLC